MRARLVAALLLVAAAPAAAQVAPAPVPTAAAPQPGTVEVVITTSEGPITLALDREHAPKTTANFLRYVDAHRFDGTAFYRALKLTDTAGLVQAGLRNAPAKLFPPVAHEPTTETHLSHTDGTVSMARDKPGSATADWFITIGDLSSLDADPAKPGDNQGFAAFGHVVSGMDLVRRIEQMPTSPTAGQGSMKGQMLADPVRILTIRRAATTDAR